MKNITLKTLILAISLLALTMCKMENSNYIKTERLLNLTSWNLPDTSKVSIPFNTTLTSFTDNSCTSNLLFVIEKFDVGVYRAYAHATYQTHGESCYDLIVEKDTTIAMTLAETGKYYFYFYNDDVLKKDSIIIIP